MNDVKGKQMTREEIEQRTKQFALQIIRFLGTLPPTQAGKVVAYQLAKSGTSVGANYREAGRAESSDDFIHKLKIAEKEAGESVYWLDICVEAPLGDPAAAIALRTEASEILAIISQSVITAKTRRR